MVFKEKRSLSREHLHDIDSVAFAHVQSLASAFGILEVNVSGLGIDSLDSLLEGRELVEHTIKSLVLVSGSEVNGILAQLTDVVAFSKEVMHLGGRCSSGKEGSEESFHS